MSDAPYHRCACIQCGVNIEFPEELAGTSAACPNCQAPQDLVPVFDEPQTPPPTSTEDPLTAAAIVGAFGSPIPRPRVSILYPIGMTLVAGFMVLLPIVYVLLTVAAAYGVYFWGTHGLGLFTHYRGGIRFSFFALAIYLAPLFAGLVLVLFMIKPLFARRLPRAQPLSMNPAAEPKLYAFIAKVCETVGAPFPSRLDLDCVMNASAGFRRVSASASAMVTKRAGCTAWAVMARSLPSEQLRRDEETLAIGVSSSRCNQSEICAGEQWIGPSRLSIEFVRGHGNRHVIPL